MDDAPGEKIKGRGFRSFTHQQDPFFQHIFPDLVFRRILIEEEDKKINIILQEDRNKIGRVSFLFSIQQLLPRVQLQLDDLPVSLLAMKVEVEMFLTGNKKGQQH